MFLQKVKKTLSSVLISLMVIAPVGGSVSATGTVTFSDVGTTHWAFKDIMKMSARQVIMGDGTGKFLPNDSVSQEQALAMALRAMGHKPEVDSYDTNNYNLDYSKVSSWAKGAVAVADEYGLLKSTDKSRFSGSSPATREWIAQLLVRTIGKDSEATSYASQSSNFADNSKISDWAASFVNLAASSTYGLIKGIPNSDGSVNFNPQGNVKRAEMAALLSRAEKYLPTPSNQTIGQVTAVNANTLTLQTSTGIQTVNVTNDTTVFINNALASISNISQGDAILAIGSPTALYIENVDTASVAQIVNGTIVKVYKDLNSLVIKDESNQMKTYTLASQVSYLNQDGSSITADQLATGDNVQLSLMMGKVTSVTRIGINSQSSNQGTIYEVDLENGLLTIQDSAGVPHIYTIDATTSVTYPDARTTGLQGLAKGMEVKLSVNDGVVSTVQVNTIIEQGTVISLSSDSTILTYTDKNGNPKVQKLAPITSVKWSDNSAASISDLKENDSILITLDSNGIKNIQISGRSTVSMDTSDLFIEGTITAIDKNAKTIVLKQTDGQLVSYKYDTIPQMFVNGITNPTIDDVKVDTTAKIQLYENKISYLNVDDRTEGSVYYVDANQHVLTLSLPNHELKSYTIDPNYTVTIRNDSSADLSDIHRNDLVRVNVDGQNVVSKISVKQDFVYKVTNVTDTSKWISVVDRNDKGYSLDLEASVVLNIPGNSQPSVKDIQLDDMIKASYIGNELEEVDVMPTTKGTVTNISTSAQQFTLQEYNGTTITVPFASGDLVKYNDTQDTSLSALSVGNRVQVSTNFNGQTEILKMKVISGKLTGFDANYIYLANMSGYRYWPYVFVHQGVYKIDLNSLQQNDTITLYQLNDFVYEINKSN